VPFTLLQASADAERIHVATIAEDACLGNRHGLAVLYSQDSGLCAFGSVGLAMAADVVRDGAARALIAPGSYAF